MPFRAFLERRFCQALLFQKLITLFLRTVVSISKSWSDERVKTISRWGDSVFPHGTQSILRRRNDELGGSEVPDNKTKRQREFDAGRSCTSTLLNRWGVSEKVGVSDDRSPIWPAGFAGSISHSDNWVWAVVAQSRDCHSIGVDTEIVVSSETLQTLHEEVITVQELSVIESLGLSPPVAFTVAFSAQEAFYKCWYPITKAFFEFKQVAIESCTPDTIRIASLDSNPNFKISPASLDVHFHTTKSDVFTATWMAQ